MNHDGSLARVTYLPGVTPPAAAVEAEVADAPVSERAVPVFRPVDTALPADEPDTVLSEEEQRQTAEDVSMRSLTRKGLSRWELGEKLRARELDAGIVEYELDRLERVGLIDDLALAETLVRTQHERKGLGRSALASELNRRRLDPEAISAALAQLDDDDERARATELALRRAPQLRSLDHDTATRRLSGFLQRKGYSSDTVRAAVLAALPRQSSGVRFR